MWLSDWTELITENIDARIFSITLANKTNNTLKGSYTRIKCDYSQGCKNYSVFTNCLVYSVYSVASDSLWCREWYSLPGSPIHGILQARILEWVAISFCRGPSQPRARICISCIDRQILYHWYTWEVPTVYIPHHWSRERLRGDTLCPR